MRVTFSRAAWLGTVAAAALITTPAFAQENPKTTPQAAPNQQTQTKAADASDQEIVITARRRSELLLDVPIAVTAYSGEQLDRQGSLDLTDIADTTPNVTLEVSRGTNSTLTAFIRGVGQQDPVAGFEQGVGVYIDDVYLNRPQAAVLDIYDVERIEVLRGPQGTLYGRNTIGGAIKYVTRRIPTDGPHVSARTNLGTYRQADLILSASTPLNDVFRVGAAAARLTRNGFGKNLTTGQENYNKDIWAARGTIEFQPSQSVFFRLSGDHTWDNSNPRGGHRLVDNLCVFAVCSGNYPVTGNVFDTYGGLNDPTQSVRAGGASLWGEIGINDWLKFRTITGYRKSHSATPIDFDALPAIDVDVPAIYRDHQFSQEFQLVADKGPLQGVAGLYYLKANAFDVFDVRIYTTGALASLPGFTVGTRGDIDTKTWAAFADLTYDFSPQWSASLGGRFTNDKRHAVIRRLNYLMGGSPELGGGDGYGAGTPFGPLASDFTGDRTDKAFTPRASISFKPDNNNNFYLSYSRGFKGGGFDPRGVSTTAPDLNGDGVRSPQEIYDYMAFDPEKVDSYELGWKSAMFERRLQFALALFQANYKDVQIPGSVAAVVNGQPTFVGETTNAAKARFRGVELETNWRVAQDIGTVGDRLNFAGTLGFLDAKFLKYPIVLAFDPQTGVPLTTPIEFDAAGLYHVQNTPKWTLSGSLDYNTPLGSGRLNANTTLSYRSSSQQFEFPIPRLDQGGFALWDANIVWRSAGDRFEIGLHGKNLTNKKYVVAGYNYLRQNPLTGEFILPSGQPGLSSGLGLAGVLTGYYGNPRQVFLSAAVNF